MPLSDPGRPPTSPIRVLIVEDHRVLAQGLELALSLHADIQVVGTAGTAEDAVRQAAELNPDVVLMDFHLPDATGAEAAQRLRAGGEDSGRPAVVMLSGDTSDDAMLQAIEAGVSAYISKTEFASQVADAVRKAADGDMLVDRSTLMRLISHQQRKSKRADEASRLRRSLTQRELDVLRLMAEGLDSHQMAERLHISVTTVRGYVQAVIEKLGAHSRLEAVAKASAHRLLDVT